MKTAFFSSLVVLLTAFQAVSSLPAEEASVTTISKRSNLLDPLPIGAKDGFYSGTLNEDGSTTWTYLGTNPFSNTTTSNSTTTSIPDSSVEKRDTGVHCTSTFVQSFDRENAVQGFANNCGNGLSWGGSAITYQSGSVIAYGCNYGKGQTCYGTTVLGFFNSIVSGCGNNKAGWHAKESWKASYGYVPVGSGFC